MNTGIPQGIDGSLPANFQQIKANFQAGLVNKLGLQALEWLYWIPMQVTVPAGEGVEQQVDIKSDAHFECLHITGDYTTLNAGGADDGTNQMTARISDGSNDLRLMDSPAPLDLFLSPGRVLSPGVAGDPSNSLFYPFPFHHIFAANGSILVEFQSAAATDNVVNLLFVGKKLRAR